MFDSIIFYLSVAATVAMAMLGAIVTGHDEWGKQNRWWIYGVFLGLGLLVGWAQIAQYEDAKQQSKETSDANRQAKEASDNLQKAMSSLSSQASQAAKALEAMNAAQAETRDVQARNLELSASNQKLAGETLQQVVGDPEKPPYLRFADYKFDDTSPPHARAYLINSSSRYAARVVSLTVKLEDQTYTSESQDISPSVDGLLSRVSVVFPGSGMLDSRMIRFNALDAAGKNQTFEVILATAAGIYRQRTLLIRISDKQIVQAWLVYKASDMSRPILSGQLGLPADFKWPQQQER